MEDLKPVCDRTVVFYVFPMFALKMRENIHALSGIWEVMENCMLKVTSKWPKWKFSIHIIFIMYYSSTFFNSSWSMQSLCFFNLTFCFPNLWMNETSDRLINIPDRQTILLMKIWLIIRNWQSLSTCWILNYQKYQLKLSLH